MITRLTVLMIVSIFCMSAKYISFYPASDQVIAKNEIKFLKPIPFDNQNPSELKKLMEASKLAFKMNLLVTQMQIACLKITLNIELEKNHKDFILNQEIEFNEHLDILRGLTDSLPKSPNITRLINLTKNIKQTWEQVEDLVNKSLLKEYMNQDDIQSISTHSQPLLNYIDSLTSVSSIIIEQPQYEDTKFLFTLFKQNILIEKMTKELLFLVYGLEVDKYSVTLPDDYSNFEDNLRDLISFNKINKFSNLDEIDKLWKEAKKIFNNIINGVNPNPEVVEELLSYSSKIIAKIKENYPAESQKAYLRD